MIAIERISDPVLRLYKIRPASLFGIPNEFVGEILNQHEFNHVRYQLVEQSLTKEYYFRWEEKNVEITIDEKGNMSSFPSGLYDRANQDAAKLHRLITKREIQENLFLSWVTVFLHQTPLHQNPLLYKTNISQS